MHKYAVITLLKVSFYKYNKPVYSKLPVFVDIVICVEVRWLYIVILSVVLIHIGRPSDLYDVQNVDWAPTLKLGHSKQPQITTGNNGWHTTTECTDNNKQQQITIDLDGSRPQQQQCSAEMVTLALCPLCSNLIGDVIVSHHEQPTLNDINNEISCQTLSWKILMGLKTMIMEDINGIEDDDQNLRSLSSCTLQSSLFTKQNPFFPILWRIFSSSLQLYGHYRKRIPLSKPKPIELQSTLVWATYFSLHLNCITLDSASKRINWDHLGSCCLKKTKNDNCIL